MVAQNVQRKSYVDAGTQYEEIESENNRHNESESVTPLKHKVKRKSKLLRKKQQGKSVLQSVSAKLPAPLPVFTPNLSEVKAMQVPSCLKEIVE